MFISILKSIAKVIAAFFAVMFVVYATFVALPDGDMRPLVIFGLAAVIFLAVKQAKKNQAALK